MAREVHFDVETRSTVDLKKCGADVYFAHPDTDLWCFAYAFDDEPPEAWWRGQPMPDVLTRHIAEGGTVVAHNAGFEYLAINKVLAARYGWPEISIEQMRCTAAMAATLALPRALGQLGTALGLDVQKDEVGSRLMRMMSKPRRMEGTTPVWWDEEAKLRRLVDYCVTDVLTEREAEKKLRPLSEFERKVWVLDHAINQRGVYVDMRAVKKAQRVVEARTKELQLELQKLTGYSVATVGQVTSITKWLQGQGLDIDALDKKSVKDALAVVENPTLRRVLEIRQEAGRASVKKLEAFANCVSADGRARGLLMYHGAATGRWTAQRLQPQNFPRAEEWWDEEASALYFKALEDGNPEWMELVLGSPITATANALRSFITAGPGNTLYGGDFSNIEGRVLAWLAGDTRKLEAFRAFDNGEGPDLYKLTASSILSLLRGTRLRPEDISKHERQGYGKVPELACGYQGGVAAFQKMAQNYDVSFTDEQADVIKSAWRENHPEIKHLWYDLEYAAYRAVVNPGQVFRVHSPQGYDYQRIEYLKKGSFLWCRLPSGRLLSYMDPQVREVRTPWDEMKRAVTFMGVDSVTRKWMRFAGYGGLWAENVTQAVARDIMVASMVRLEDAGYPLVLTVHDEMLSETPKGFGSVEEFTRLARSLPPWADKLPVFVDADEMFRYSK